jgi:hypothetical protein
VTVNTSGGGVIGQVGAISLGPARAFEKMNSELRTVLKKGGLPTRDGRAKERKQQDNREQENDSSSPRDTIFSRRSYFHDNWNMMQFIFFNLLFEFLARSGIQAASIAGIWFFLR